MLLHLPMALIVLFAIGPYLWMLITSLKQIGRAHV